MDARANSEPLGPTPGQVRTGVATGRPDRWAAVAGLVFTALVLASFFMPDVPTSDSPAEDIGARLAEDSTAHRLSLLLGLLSDVAFLVFLAGLWSRLRRAEGPAGMFAALVLTAGGAFVALMLISGGPAPGARPVRLRRPARPGSPARPRRPQPVGGCDHPGPQCRDVPRGDDGHPDHPCAAAVAGLACCRHGRAAAHRSSGSIPGNHRGSGRHRRLRRLPALPGLGPGHEHSAAATARPAAGWSITARSPELFDAPLPYRWTSSAWGLVSLLTAVIPHGTTSFTR